MRVLILAFLLLVPPSLAFADEIDDATTQAIFALATKGYTDPAKAEMRDVHKSLAKNGKGYCGEVTIEGSADFTGFHAILEGGTGPSVLRLSDFPAGDPRADTVLRLMHNFGCIK
jgi:hypothetical protein